jgi:hypothetical protein
LQNRGRATYANTDYYTEGMSITFSARNHTVSGKAYDQGGESFSGTYHISGRSIVIRTNNLWNGDDGVLRGTFSKNCSSIRISNYDVIEGSSRTVYLR